MQTKKWTENMLFEVFKLFTVYFSNLAIRISKKFFGRSFYIEAFPLQGGFQFVGCFYYFLNVARYCNLLPLKKTSRAERHGTAVDLFRKA